MDQRWCLGSYQLIVADLVAFNHDRVPWRATEQLKKILDRY